MEPKLRRCQSKIKGGTSSINLFRIVGAVPDLKELKKNVVGEGSAFKTLIYKSLGEKVNVRVLSQEQGC